MRRFGDNPRKPNYQAAVVWAAGVSLGVCGLVMAVRAVGEVFGL